MFHVVNVPFFVSKNLKKNYIFIQSNILSCRILRNFESILFLDKLVYCFFFFNHQLNRLIFYIFFLFYLLLTEEPQPSKGCPRANGYFKHEDPLMCDRFVNCIDGVASVMPCPPGLIYDDKMSSCIWAIDSEMPCHSKREQLDDGFICPDEVVTGPGGRLLPHPTYPHPDDCAKFYICRNGVQPQKGQCEYGTVYDELTFRCNEPESVPGWYVKKKKKKKKNFYFQLL